MKILRTLFKLKLYVALFGVGYLAHSCVSNDYRYRIRRHHSQPYLVDTQQNEALPIDPATFQVGSPEYRLRGLLEEPNLHTIVETLRQEVKQ